MTELVQMGLGDIEFSLKAAAYSTIERRARYRWAEVERIGAHAALQYMGPGEETLSLPGVILPELTGPAGLGAMKRLREEAAKGEPLLLIDGTGVVHGYWCITEVSETGSVFFPDGTPRRIEFSVELRYYGD